MQFHRMRRNTAQLMNGAPFPYLRLPFPSLPSLSLPRSTPPFHVDPAT